MTGIDVKARIFAEAKMLRLSLHLDALPVTPAGLEALAKKKIVLVDDGLDVLAVFLVPLMVATQGAAGFVLQTAQSKDQTIEEILLKNPDIVLIDEYLRGFRGHLLIEPLLQRKPGLICLGFSNAASAEAVFREAGAKGFVFKEQSDPWLSLNHVAAMLRSNEEMDN